MKTIIKMMLAIVIAATTCMAQSSVPSTVAELAVDTGDGYGSVGLYARRFANVTVNSGSSISMTSSAIDGDSFFISEDGIYTMSLTDYSSVGDAVSISINSDPSLPIDSLVTANKLCTAALPAYNLHGCAATTGLLVGDVIRVHRSIGGNCSCVDNTSYVRFIITRIN